MAETLEELTYDYEDEGTLVRKEIDRAVLTKGSWATVMFLFQELDRAKGKFRPPKMAIVRFKKSKGSYRKQSSFNISNEKQARQIVEVFERWYPKIAEVTAERRRGCGRSTPSDTARADVPTVATTPAREPGWRELQDRSPSSSTRGRARTGATRGWRPSSRPSSATRVGCWRRRRSRSSTRRRRRCGRTPPAIIAVHGGDGTLHRTITALGRAFGDDPIPPIAILCGGTMNVVATSLGIRERPTAFLTALGRRGRPRRPSPRHHPPALPAGRRPARLRVRQRPDVELPRRVLRDRTLRPRPGGLAARCGRSARC